MHYSWLDKLVNVMHIVDLNLKNVSKKEEYMYVTVQRRENHYTDLLLNCNRIDVENEQLVVMFLKRSHIDHS